MKVLCLILGSRKFWIALTALVGDVCVVAGADPAKWTPLLMSINALAIVLVGAISHEDAAEKRAGFHPQLDPCDLNDDDDADETQTTEQSMKKLFGSSPTAGSPPTAAVAALILGIFALLLTAGGGCTAASPTARWAQARDTLSTAEKTITLQHRAGTISDADLVALDASVQAARKALDQAQGQLDTPAGGSTQAFEFYLKLTDSILDQLSGGKLDKVKTAAPATAPAHNNPPSTIHTQGAIDGTGGNPGGTSHGAGDLRLGRASGSDAKAEWRVHRRAA